jgi:putative hemolysin
MSLIYIELISFFIALLFAGVFAYLETAFTALRLFKIKELNVGVSKYKDLFACWEKNPQRILITILIANNLAHVISSVLITKIMEQLFGGIGLVIGVGIATVTILVFGEIIPKTFAKAHHEKLFKVFLWLIDSLVRILYPVVSFLLKLADFFFRKLGKGHVLEKAPEEISEKELEFLIDYSDEKGIIESEKSEMLQNVFGLGQTLVNQIMIPKIDMIVIDVNSSLQGAMEIFLKSRFSRLPVYEGKEDNIIGILYHKDLFEVCSKGEKKSLKELIRKVLFVPESKKTNQLLSEFLNNKMHMAILIDEYGGVVGLVTLEDVLEEIVGEIRDEHESGFTQVMPLEKGGWIVEGGISLNNLEEVLGIKFTAEDSVTLGGFLAEILQHLPKKGERISYKGYCFQVQQASAKRVLQVLIFEEGKQP